MFIPGCSTIWVNFPFEMSYFFYFNIWAIQWNFGKYFFIITFSFLIKNYFDFELGNEYYIWHLSICSINHSYIIGKILNPIFLWEKRRMRNASAPHLNFYFIKYQSLLISTLKFAWVKWQKSTYRTSKGATRFFIKELSLPNPRTFLMRLRKQML